MIPKHVLRVYRAAMREQRAYTEPEKFRKCEMAPESWALQLACRAAAKVEAKARRKS